MKLAWFGVEEWLNPMDSLAKYNLGSSCVSAFNMRELFECTGQDLDKFLEDMREFSLHYHHGDATGSPRVKKAVTGIYPKAGLTPEDVMMVIGGTGANDLTIFSILEHGDNCVVIKPSYQQHYDIPKGMGIETRIVQLKAEDNYVLNLDDVEAACDENTKLIILTNPNNPIGITLYDKELSRLVEIAKKFDAWILCDEMYRGLDENYMPSILDYGYTKAVSACSLSKMFSMAGTRIGWIICRDREMYEVIKTRRSYNTICCGIFDELVGSIALENYEKVWARARSILLPNREIVKEWVSRQPHLKMLAEPMGTTCLIDYDYDVDSETMAKESMEADKILFVPGDYFDMPKTIRVGYGAFRNPDDLKASLAAFEKFLKRYE